MSQEERSKALIEVLEDLQESDIEFVLVGGYAVSQFETRFSTDLDLVIAPDDIRNRQSSKMQLNTELHQKSRCCLALHKL